jgi:hypothetical protein
VRVGACESKDPEFHPGLQISTGLDLSLGVGDAEEDNLSD